MAKILVVDDQEMMRDSLASALTRSGYSVDTRTAPSGPVAEWARSATEVTGESVELAYVDQGYTATMPKSQRPTKGSTWRW